jgi:ribosomal protein S18 acetylase RimI-like enzyme
MALAKCHKICFPDSLSDKLGLKYIAKTFHWFLNDNNKFLYHFQNANGEIVGYCGGFVSQGIGDGSSSGMLQHAFKEAVIGIIKKPWLIFNKEVVAAYPFIFKNIKRKIFPSSYKKNFKPYSSIEQKYAGLVVIAVHPAYRGKGVFEELMNQFFIEAKQKGAIGGSLSVRKDNVRGIGAYKKNDWKIVKEDKYTFVMQKIVHN